MRKPQFQASFDLGNEEFDEPEKRAAGIARILRETADRVEVGVYDGGLYDVNGNHVGNWDFDEVEEPEEPETRACSACGERTRIDDPECHQCGNGA